MQTHRVKEWFYIQQAVFWFVFSSLSLSGIPLLSRTPHFFLVVLFFALLPRVLINKTIRFKAEYCAPIIFVLLVGVLSFFGRDSAIDAFMATAISWFGGCSIAFFVRNGYVKIDTVLYALVAASVTNSISVIAGFDSYAAYSADFREVSEDALSLRASGMVGNANLMCVQAILPLFALVLWGNKSRFINWIWPVCLGSGLYSLAASGSRKGVVLFLFYLCFLLIIFFLRSNRSRFGLYTVVSSLILVLAILFFNFDYDVRQLVAVDRIFQALEGNDRSFDERSGFIEIGWVMFFQSPLYGYGLDMFRHLSGTGLYSHNNLIEMAVSGGMLMLFSFYIMYLIVIVKRLKYRNEQPDVFWGSILLLCILFFLDFSMVTYSVRIYAYFVSILLIYKPSIVTARRPA